jgi:ABC-type multidrug transport system fused ATPase/permease subunit
MRPDVFLVLFTLCLNIYNTITGVAGSVYRFDDGLDAMNKQRHFFEIAPMHDPMSDADKADTPKDENSVFEVKNLTFDYSQEKRAINNVSFTVKKGELVALVGQNGSVSRRSLSCYLICIARPQLGKNNGPQLR